LKPGYFKYVICFIRGHDLATCSNTPPRVICVQQKDSSRTKSYMRATKG
jgi:hypothetical protein